MDFFRVAIRELKDKSLEIYPDYIVGRSKDLLVRGGHFYAIWDEETGLWSTDEYDVQRLVDGEIKRYVDKLDLMVPHTVKYLRSSTSGSWYNFKKFVALLSDNSHQLDENLTFANSEVSKNDYVSKRLPYNLAHGDFSSWDELVGTHWSVEERAKIEWAIGAIVSGDAKKIQKFLVLYGPAGTGKSTILNVIYKMFGPYSTTFEAKALASSNGSFATEAFKHNPLVAFQHDGDLSRIEDNTRLNSIIAHEEMTMNEKYKASYTAKVNAFLFMGTNQPVKITDAKSGIIRRLIDVHPTGVRIPPNHYNTLMSKIDFELGAIAQRCLDVYLEMGKNYYNTYKPLEMMLQTDVFFNFVEHSWDVFKEQDYTTLSQAYLMYKEFCADTGIARMLPQYKFREELRNYFNEFKDRAVIDGNSVRSYYGGFSAHPFKAPAKDENIFKLVVEETDSLLDRVLAEAPAQKAIWDEEIGTYRPELKWKNSKTKLQDINTSELHFVKLPEQHIVIDFDLTDESGAKSLERNLEAASVWPPTYAELSQGGSGVHLHYNFEGDVSTLASLYSEGIEVKTLLGDAGLRRRLSKCNNVPIATINSGLPQKEKKVLSDTTIKSEKALRDLIERNLRKQIHPGTKSSVDFIKHILDEAVTNGLVFDVSDMKPRVLAFANRSTNQSLIALKTVQQMQFKNEAETSTEVEARTDAPIVFFDVEVYPNLFIVCWKKQGDGNVVKMINPSVTEIEQLVKMRLVGFYNRRYDNHVLYAALLGYTPEQLFDLSQKIIVNHRNEAMFGEAYNLSYADIWDFASIKQSLKKWEIDLGIKHVEIDIPWDKPVPKEKIQQVVDYCVNDVVATEAVFENRKADFNARMILAELSGLSVNDTTQRHTAKIIFEGDRNASAQFIYTDLKKEFPGYEFDLGKSTYRGEDPSEGGYVFARYGIWHSVGVLDIASMHPTSIIQLNYFGEYTKNFAALLEARLAIKRGDYATARGLLGGRLSPYLGDEADAKALSYALKIVVNIVYGLTSAKFDNPFRNLKNKDNIVAKRGALFMIDLKHYVEEELGAEVVHIKTDSIKIPNITPEIVEAVTNFGDKYGYTFEWETTYEKMALVNDAVFIAKDDSGWHATGAQFQHPYVFKTLFSHEDIEFRDLCEAKQVTKGYMYLDLEYDRATPLVDSMQYIGKNGLFIPVLEGTPGAGMLYRVTDDNDQKLYAVTGTKGYLWIQAEMAKELNVSEDNIDYRYFDKLVDDARKQIEKYGDFDAFVR